MQFVENTQILKLPYDSSSLLFSFPIYTYNFNYLSHLPSFKINSATVISVCMFLPYSIYRPQSLNSTFITERELMEI
jgi:hypothetical protein